jgi:hypothetical protein
VAEGSGGLQGWLWTAPSTSSPWLRPQWIARSCSRGSIANRRCRRRRQPLSEEQSATLLGGHRIEQMMQMRQRLSTEEKQRWRPQGHACNLGWLYFCRTP